MLTQNLSEHHMFTPLDNGHLQYCAQQAHMLPILVSHAWSFANERIAVVHQTCLDSKCLSCLRLVPPNTPHIKHRACQSNLVIPITPCHYAGATWQRFLQGQTQPSTEASTHSNSSNGQLQQLKCSSSVVLLVNVYNNALMGWEPLLEPWQVAVDIVR